MMGHWYQIVSIDYHEHVMTGRMVLRQRYALVFVSSDARKPLPRDGLPKMGVLAELGR